VPEMLAGRFAGGALDSRLPVGEALPGVVGTQRDLGEVG
jgi:hypothetical protein